MRVAQQRGEHRKNPWLIVDDENSGGSSLHEAQRPAVQFGHRLAPGIVSLLASTARPALRLFVGREVQQTNPHAPLCLEADMQNLIFMPGDNSNDRSLTRITGGDPAHET